MKDNMETVKNEELVRRIANRRGADTSTTYDFLNAFLAEVEAAVAAGDKVSLSGFGTFEGRHRKATTHRNPRTGEPIPTEATTIPAFKAAKNFKELVAAAAKGAA